MPATQLSPVNGERRPFPIRVDGDGYGPPFSSECTGGVREIGSCPIGLGTIRVLLTRSICVCYDCPFDGVALKGVFAWHVCKSVN